MLDHLIRRRPFGKLIDQALRGVDQCLGGAGVVDRGVHLALQLIRRDAGIAPQAGPRDRAALLHLHRRVTLIETADSVQSMRRAVGVVLTVLEQLRMRPRDVIRLHEGLEGRLPVAVEDHPLPPLEAHLLELEGIEKARSGLEVFAQTYGARVHVDEEPAAPSVDLDLAERGALLIEHTLPVLLVEDISILAVQVVGPAVKPANERLPVPAGAVLAGRCIDQPAAAMRADVMVRLDGSGRGAHDQDRVLADLVGDVVARLGDFLDTAGDLPHPRPEAIGFGAGILRRNEGFDRVGHGLFQIFDAHVAQCVHMPSYN